MKKNLKIFSILSLFLLSSCSFKNKIYNEFIEVEFDLSYLYKKIPEVSIKYNDIHMSSYGFEKVDEILSPILKKGSFFLFPGRDPYYSKEAVLSYEFVDDKDQSKEYYFMLCDDMEKQEKENIFENTNSEDNLGYFVQVFSKFVPLKEKDAKKYGGEDWWYSYLAAFKFNSKESYLAYRDIIENS